MLQRHARRESKQGSQQSSHQRKSRNRSSFFHHVHTAAKTTKQQVEKARKVHAHTDAQHSEFKRKHRLIENTKIFGMLSSFVSLCLKVVDPIDIPSVTK